MLRLIGYMLSNGIATTKAIPEVLELPQRGLPSPTGQPCQTGCSACVEACPTVAIAITGDKPQLDRGACIGCGDCVALCPTDAIENDLTVATYAFTREELICGATRKSPALTAGNSMFRSSMAVRVVSTGCSACDLELSAAFNPIFDMERFGIQVVASPRFADALIVTGPVPCAMHDALRDTFEAMAEPKIVIAAGTCAITGGVHKHGYAQANGVGAVLPVDLFIPGCPPHPWSLIAGILAARNLKDRR